MSAPPDMTDMGSHATHRRVGLIALHHFRRHGASLPTCSRSGCALSVGCKEVNADLFRQPVLQRCCKHCLSMLFSAVLLISESHRANGGERQADQGRTIGCGPSGLNAGRSARSPKRNGRHRGRGVAEINCEPQSRADGVPCSAADRARLRRPYFGLFFSETLLKAGLCGRYRKEAAQRVAC
jgi:hypothetical protein